MQNSIRILRPAPSGGRFSLFSSLRFVFAANSRYLTRAPCLHPANPRNTCPFAGFHRSPRPVPPVLMRPPPAACGLAGHPRVRAPSSSPYCTAKLSPRFSGVSTVSCCSRCRRSSQGCRILYVSPLKALAVDVERNLLLPCRHGQHGPAWALPSATHHQRPYGDTRSRACPILAPASTFSSPLRSRSICCSPRWPPTSAHR